MDTDKAIVTIIDENRNFRTDLELPTEVRMSKLETELGVFLSELLPRVYGGVKKFKLIAQGAELEENETLASRGLWSGSVINIKGE